MKPPPSSNAFALPIAVSVLPPARIAAVIVALHCVPLPLLFAAMRGAWLAAAVAAAMASLALMLHRQRRAVAARRLITAGDEWRLYRGRDGVADTPGEAIELIDGAVCGRFTWLLVAQHGRRFHLAVDSRAQPHEQLHRLRVWLAHRTADAMVDSKRPWRG